MESMAHFLLVRSTREPRAVGFLAEQRFIQERKTRRRGSQEHIKGFVALLHPKARPEISIAQRLRRRYCNDLNLRRSLFPFLTLSLGKSERTIAVKNIPQVTADGRSVLEGTPAADSGNQ